MERNVPKLRFKGFNDEWKQKKLKDISTYVNRTIAENETIENVLTISAGKGFLNQKDRFSQVIAGNSLKKYTVLYNNEFSYNRGNSKKYTYGCIYKLENYEKALVPNVYISFKINNGVEDYYKQLFVKKYLDRQLRQLISSSARMDGLLNINKEDFFNVHVPVPSLEEQERIANFLTKVDKIIEKQDEKVKNLENYKKGMMQKIFSQEIRFKDENWEEYPEWEEKKLGSIFSISAGGDISRENVSERKDKKYVYPIYSNSLNNDGLYGYSDIYKINKETITVTGRGTIGVAKARYEKYYPIVRLLVLNPKIKCNIKFFEEAINNTKIFIESTGVPQLTAPQLSDLKIKYACIDEQEKIANILSNIDNIVDKEKNKLEELKRWKKGLLQQMFV